MEQTPAQADKIIEDLLQKGKEARQYLDIVGVMIGIVDASGITRFINSKGAALLGYPEAEIVGTNWIDRFVPEEQRAKTYEVLHNLVAGNATPFEYHENEVVDVQGNRRIIAFHNQPLRNAGGAIIGVLFSGEDITHHKKIEQQLTERTNLLEAIGEHLPIGYAINAISDEKFITMNRKFQEFYGWPKEVLVDVNSFFEHVYPDPEFRKKISEQVRADMMSGDPKRMIWEKVPITRQSGEVAYISAQNVPLYENDLMISTVWDVTRQVAVEKALQESYHVQRAIIDTIPDVVWMKGISGVYLAANEAFLQWVKKRREDVIGETDLAFWPKEYAEKYRADDLAVMNSCLQKRITETVPDQQGNIIQVETIKTPVYDDAGELLGVAGVARTIIAEKHLKEEHEQKAA